MKSYKNYLVEKTIKMRKGEAEILFPDSYKATMNIIPKNMLIHADVKQSIARYFSIDQGKDFQSKDKTYSYEKPYNFYGNEVITTYPVQSSILMVVKSDDVVSIVLMPLTRHQQRAKLDTVIYHLNDKEEDSYNYMNTRNAMQKKYGFNLNKDMRQTDKQLGILINMHKKVWRY